MFKFDKADVQRVAASAFGALTITAVTMFATAAPVKAAPLAPAAAVVNQVAR